MSEVAARTESLVMVSGNTMVVTETVDEVEAKLNEGNGNPWMDLTLTDGKRFRVSRRAVSAYWAGRYE